VCHPTKHTSAVAEYAWRLFALAKRDNSPHFNVYQFIHNAGHVAHGVDGIKHLGIQLFGHRSASEQGGTLSG
jgi:hypothetical protein